MKKKILIILLSVAMVFSFTACGGSSNSEGAESVAAEETTEAPEAEMTTAQENAVESARSYLDYAGFSKQGLIDQLSSDAGDGYKLEDAEFAVNYLEEQGEVDWVEEAKEAAQSYLDMTSFSKDGLIEQLESSAGDQFTHDEAVEAVEAVYK